MLAHCAHIALGRGERVGPSLPSNHETSLLALASLLCVIALVVAVCYIAYLASDRIARTLGRTGNIVLSRLLGVLLAALAVQYVLDGIGAFFGR